MAKESFLDKHQDKVNFIIAIVLLLAVVFVFSLIKVYFQSPGEVVAQVNDRYIYRMELDNRMESMPVDMQLAHSEDIVLEQMIEEALLLDRVENLGLEATEQEMDQAVQNFMETNGLDQETLEQILQIQGFTYRQFLNTIEQQVLLNKLLETEVFADISVSDEQVRDYYNQNAEYFIVPEQATVRQAMVTMDNRMQREARLLAEEIMYDAAENFSSMCSIAAEKLAEGGAACGAYNITRFSGLPEEFVNASFDLPVDEAGIVMTEFGYHVIYKEGTTPERMMSFTEVRDRIRDTITNSMQQQAYREYVVELKENANITNYLLEGKVQNLTPRQDIGEDEISACLSEKAVLYGASWDAQTKEQLEMLGDLNVTYIECSEGRVDDQAQVCEEAGIEAYPTWIINGQKHLGKETVEGLAVLANC